MGIGNLMRTATVERIPVQDRSRDMGKMLRDATDRGDPVDEISDGMRQLVAADLDADQYGRRQQKYEHQEIILSNELVNLIGKIDRDGEELRAKTEEVLRIHGDVKAVLQKYVIDLNCHMQRQMAVVAVCRDEILGMNARIMETLNAKTTHAPRGNGNGGAHANGGGEPHDGEELRHAPSDEEGARTLQAQIHR